MSAAKQWPQDDKTEVLAYVRNGVKASEIVQLTGVPKSTITRWVRASGLSFERQPSPEAIDAIKKDSRERRQIKLARLLDEIDAGIERLSREPNANGFRLAAQGIASLTKAYSDIKRFTLDDSGQDVQGIMGQFVAGIALNAEGFPPVNAFGGSDASELESARVCRPRSPRC